MLEHLLLATVATESSVQSVKMYADQYQRGEEGFADFQDLAWIEVQNYPISRLHDAVDVDWFVAEQKMWADDGMPEWFDEMLHHPIQIPVVVYDNGHRGWTWDGNHRVGATLTKGETTIPATVGLPLALFQSLARGEPHPMFKLQSATEACAAWAWLQTHSAQAEPEAPHA